MKPKELFYRFRIEVLSCSGNEEWIHRHDTLTSNAWDPTRAAGDILTAHNKLTEQGVRITFLGLQEGQGKDAGPITQMGPFTLTWLRVQPQPGSELIYDLPNQTSASPVQ